MAALSDPDVRRRLDAGANSEEAGLLRGLASWRGLEVIEAFAPENQAHEGRTIGQIMDERGGDLDPFDVLLDIVVADELRTGLRPSGLKDSEPDWQLRAEVWRDPRAVIGGSDAGAHLDMMCGAIYSTALLSHGVREFGVLSLEEAIHRITDVPARLYGLRERGRIQPGWAADLVVFDPDTVGYEPERMRYDLPGGAWRLHSDATGIERVLVNGVTIVEGGEPTGATPGTLLRSGRDTETVRAVKVEIDRERCMGSGNCIYWAAKVFDVGDDMIAVVIGDPDEHRERVELAAEHCPTNAIRFGRLDLPRPPTDLRELELLRQAVEDDEPLGVARRDRREPAAAEEGAEHLGGVRRRVPGRVRSWPASAAATAARRNASPSSTWVPSSARSTSSPSTRRASALPTIRVDSPVAAFTSSTVVAPSTSAATTRRRSSSASSPTMAAASGTGGSTSSMPPVYQRLCTISSAYPTFSSHRRRARSGRQELAGGGGRGGRARLGSR